MVPNINSAETEQQHGVALATTSTDASFNEAVAANIGEMGLTVDDFPRLKVPSGGDTNWVVPGLSGVHMEQALEGVIVYKRTTRAYWLLAADDPKGGKNPPNCTSTNGLVGIGDPGGCCANVDPRLVCPLAKYGSAKGGTGPGQSCKEVTQLFFLRGDSMLPEVIALPPTSVKPARKYFVRLTANKVPYFGMLTRLTLIQKTSAGNKAYAVAQLEPVRPLTGEQLRNARDFNKMIGPMLQSLGADTETASESAGQEE